MSKKINRAPIILAAIGLVVFFGSLILRNEAGLFISPDETANAFFTERFAVTNSFNYFDPLNIDLSNSLHPRSVVVISGAMVPVSFTGLPVIYGFLVKIFGSGLLLFLTPLIAFGALFAFYGICRRVFSERVSLLASVLWAVHPGWWYYTARPLMHNVLFVSLVIISVYLLVARPFQGWGKKIVGKKIQKNLWLNLDIILAGLSFGLALFVRTSETLWLISAFALAGYLAVRKIAWQPVIVFGASVLIALIPMFVVNQITFGGPLTFGYQIDSSVDADLAVAVMNSDVVNPNVQVKSQLRQGIEKVLSPLFPFGIAPRAITRNVIGYLFTIFWWLTLLVLIGLPLFLPQKKQEKPERRKRIAYLAVFGLVFVWLAVMYGSWAIADNPDPTSLTLANSYVRYWLPIYALATPFMAMGIFWLTERTRTKVAQNIALGVLLVVCFGLSIRVVYFAPEDGLTEVSATLERSAEIRERVFSHVEPEAVIIVDRADKIFWPERRVRYPLRNEVTYALMPRITLRVPLYYYGITFPQEDLDYLNQEKLAENNLRISLVETFDAESLYWITPIR